MFARDIVSLSRKETEDFFFFNVLYLIDTFPFYRAKDEGKRKERIEHDVVRSGVKRNRKTIRLRIIQHPCTSQLSRLTGRIPRSKS